MSSAVQAIGGYASVSDLFLYSLFLTTRRMLAFQTAMTVTCANLQMSLKQKSHCQIQTAYAL